MFDVAFRAQVRGGLPPDHGYALFGALSRVWPWLHAARGVFVHPLSRHELRMRVDDVAGRLQCTQEHRRVMRRYAGVRCGAQHTTFGESAVEKIQ